MAETGKWLRTPPSSQWPSMPRWCRPCQSAAISQICGKLKSSCYLSRASPGRGACCIAANGEMSGSEGTGLGPLALGLAEMIRLCGCCRSAELAFSLPALPLAELQPPPPLTEVRTSFRRGLPISREVGRPVPGGERPAQQECGGNPSIERAGYFF